MKKVLLMAVVGAIVAATPVIAGAQEFQRAGDFYLAGAVQPQPAAPARPPAAPVAPGTVPPPAQPAPPAPAAAPLSRSAMNNIKFDVTITDTAVAKPVTKTVSMTVAPGNNGSIRSSAKAGDSSAGIVNPAAMVTSWLNVDVRGVNTIDANTVRAQISVEYQAYVADAKTQPGAVSANSTSIFTDGRRTQILVTSDPASDRRTTIEVTATILK